MARSRAIPDSDAAEEQLLRELAADEKASFAVRMRALEVLERKRARREGAMAAQELPGDAAPDPFADFDEVEQARQRKARRGPQRGRAAR
jgi:hypothetical protein